MSYLGGWWCIRQLPNQNDSNSTSIGQTGRFCACPGFGTVIDARGNMSRIQQINQIGNSCEENEIYNPGDKV